MKKFLVCLLSTLGALTLVVMITGLWVFKHYVKSEHSLPEEMILTLHIGGESLTETNHDRGLLSTLLKGKQASHNLKDIVFTLAHAKEDKKVKGILLVIEGHSLGFAQIQEIKDTLKNFKNSGKPVYAFADTFGDLSNGTGSYYLATSADQIWLQPVGNLGLTGMFIESPFARKALDNFNILPQIGRREEYKGFMESLTESDYTPPVRANMQRIINGLMTQVEAEISNCRNLTTETVHHLINNAPYVSAEALKEKLIDQVGYLDVLKTKLMKDTKVKGSLQDSFVSLTHYASHMPKDPHHKNQIALIFGEGTILKSEKGGGFVDSGYFIDAKKMSKAIQEAQEDESVKAIVLRLNSGGGSPAASETIWRHLKMAQERGKPIIISMSDYTASGAYWIATAANKIVAHPGTLTGSIGVLAGKIVTEGAWEKYGVHWGEIHKGENSSMWSTGKNYTDREWQRLQATLDDIYQTFLIKVSEARHMDKERAHSLAKGQVWTGLEAKENGLVDALGGLTTAIELAKSEARITSETPVSLQEFPKPMPLVERLMGSTDDEDEIGGGFFGKLSSLSATLNRWMTLFMDLTTTEPLKAQTVRVK